MSQQQQLRDALALVFGTNATKDQYSTAHVLAVMRKLLGSSAPGLLEDELIQELRQLSWAHPRPGKGKHLLLWRFTNADGARTPQVTARRRPPKREKPLAETMKLKRA